MYAAIGLGALVLAAAVAWVLPRVHARSEHERYMSALVADWPLLRRGS